jgi:NAD(P)-dependent dehydrogenase (short-subunit alcohol dehydrogenase family)
MGPSIQPHSALIVGAGSGLSASLARLFARQGLQVALAARNPDKLAKLAGETAAVTFAVEVAEPEEVGGLFDAVIATFGVPDVVVFNASARVQGPITGLDPVQVANTLDVGAYGGFLVGQQAARHLLARDETDQPRGTILFTGASASVKGYAGSAPFAMAKFALRGLAQSMARELAPQGIHVAHIIIDGAIRPAGATEPPDAPDSLLDPDAIAATYWHVITQDRSAWSWEVEVRPWTERF